MFCEHCGAELPEGTEICTECGKPTREPDFSEEVSAPSRRKSARAKKKKTPITRKQLILIGSGAAALVLAVVIIIVIALGGYKRPVRNFFAALNDSDAQKLSAAVYSGTENYDSYVQERDEAYWESADAGMEQTLQMLADRFSELSGEEIAAKDIHFGYKITEAVKLTGDELSQAISDLYYQGYNTAKVTQVYRLTVKVTFEAGTNRLTVQMKDLYAVKCNGKWSFCMDAGFLVNTFSIY